MSEGNGGGDVQGVQAKLEDPGKGWYLNRQACRVLGRQANRSTERVSTTRIDIQKVPFE